VLGDRFAERVALLRVLDGLVGDCCAAPTQQSAMIAGCSPNAVIAWMNPPLSSPSRFSAGTRTPSNVTDPRCDSPVAERAVDAARDPGSSNARQRADAARALAVIAREHDRRVRSRERDRAFSPVTRAVAVAGPVVVSAPRPSPLPARKAERDRIPARELRQPLLLTPDEGVTREESPANHAELNEQRHVVVAAPSSRRPMPPSQYVASVPAESPGTKAGDASSASSRIRSRGTAYAVVARVFGRSRSAA